FASLNPVAYSGGQLERMEELADADRKELGRFNRLREKAKAEFALPQNAPPAEDASFGRQVKESLEKRLDLGKSVTSVASASKLGDYFQYVIDRPVSLPRQK